MLRAWMCAFSLLLCAMLITACVVSVVRPITKTTLNYRIELHAGLLVVTTRLAPDWFPQRNYGRTFRRSPGFSFSAAPVSCQIENDSTFTGVRLIDTPVASSRRFALWYPTLLLILTSSCLVSSVFRPRSDQTRSRFKPLLWLLPVVVLIGVTASWNRGSDILLRNYKYIIFEDGLVEYGSYPMASRGPSTGLQIFPSLTRPNALNLRAVRIPVWHLALASTIVAGWVIGVSLRRRPPGQCVRCGYSRSGLALSAPCPECGGDRTG